MLVPGPGGVLETWCHSTAGRELTTALYCSLSLCFPRRQDTLDAFTSACHLRSSRGEDFGGPKGIFSLPHKAWLACVSDVSVPIGERVRVVYIARDNGLLVREGLLRR